MSVFNVIATNRSVISDRTELIVGQLYADTIEEVIEIAEAYEFVGEVLGVALAGEPGRSSFYTVFPVVTQEVAGPPITKRVASTQPQTWPLV